MVHPLQTLSLLQLAEKIAEDAQNLVKGLKQYSLPEPSFAEDGPSPDYIGAKYPDLHQLRRQIVGSARILAILATGPKMGLAEELVFASHYSSAMHIVYGYDLPSHVPVGGSISYADLAAASGLEESKLRRVVRLVSASGVFIESKPNHVSHSAITKLLATDPSTMAILGHQTEDLNPYISKQVAAMKKWPGGESPLHCAVGYVEETPIFDLFASDQPRVERFTQAMLFFSGEGGPSHVKTAVSTFDWDAIGSGLLLDVGGSGGHAAADILSIAPKMKAIVQDLPEVIAAPKTIPDSVKDRVSFEAYNFFEPQPNKEADVYYFRHILHDWPDQKCIEILGNTVPAMKKGSRLILNECIILPSNEGEYMDNRVNYTIDMQMMVAINGKERTLQQWKEIVIDPFPGQLELQAASGRLLVFKKL